MMRDAAMPPTQASTGMTVAQVFGVGVDGGRRGADGAAEQTEQTEQDASERNCPRICPRGRRLGLGARGDVVA
jgi:hypothetical protein